MLKSSQFAFIFGISWMALTTIGKCGRRCPRSLLWQFVGLALAFTGWNAADAGLITNGSLSVTVDNTN